MAFLDYWNFVVLDEFETGCVGGQAQAGDLFSDGHDVSILEDIQCDEETS